MSNKPIERLCDVRIQERNQRKGLLSAKDYQAYLKQLPDAANKAQVIDKERIFGGEPSRIKGALVDHRVKQVQVRAPADYDELANVNS